MRKYLLPVAVAAAAAAVAPAQAITIDFSQGTYAVPSYITVASRTSVENFDAAAPGLFPGSTNAIVTSSTIPGQFVDPQPLATGNYLAVQGAGQYIANLGGSQVFSFILGSLDQYNTLELTLGSGSIVTLAGGAIIGQPGSPAPLGVAYGNPLLAGRVTYDLGGLDSFVSAKFTSTSNSFEIDDLVTAAPEPATWGMMILGFGLAGAQLRSRRRSAKLAVA